MDKKSLMRHDINRVNSHHKFGIAEKVIMPVQKNNTFTKEFERMIIWELMHFCTPSMSTMLAITKHGVCVGIIAPCLVNFIMVDMEWVQKCISAYPLTVFIINTYHKLI